MNVRVLGTLTGLLALPSVGQAAAPVPGFSELEAQYSHDASLSSARGELAAAIPAGTPVRSAEQSLTNAGAECREKRKTPNVVRCLIHQYSFADRAADDIRWTISLDVFDDSVTGFKLDRYVDRHGN